MSKRNPDPQRRRLLAAARNLTAAAAGATVLGPAGAVAPRQAAPLPKPPANEHRGYRESEHTRRYYQLARY